MHKNLGTLNQRHCAVFDGVFENANTIYIMCGSLFTVGVDFMGRKPLRECLKCGCHNLTRSGYCGIHKAERQDKARHKFYDSTKRDKQAAEFYKSTAWKKVRAQAMARAHYLCQDCLKRGVINKAEMVHHIKPLREFPELALDINNLKPLCYKCHGRY